MRGRSIGISMLWLLGVAAAQAAAFVAVWRYFVLTESGQRFDTIALEGNTIGQDRVDGLVDTVLNAVSVVSLAAATVVIGFIALARRRFLLAVAATLLVCGANVTTQLLKFGLDRPVLGVDPERASAGNSLPSGHTTVAASVAIALVLVLPPRLRGPAAVLGTCYATLTGVATLSAGWHRPSDAVAALLVVGVWAAFAGFLQVGTQWQETVVDSQEAHRASLLLLALAGLLLLAAAAGAVLLTGEVLEVPPDELSARRLFVAYAGSAVGIAGAAALVMALVLVSAHRVVPRRTG